MKHVGNGTFHQLFLIHRIHIFLIDVIDDVVNLVELPRPEGKNGTGVPVRLIHPHTDVNTECKQSGKDQGQPNLQIFQCLRFIGSELKLNFFQNVLGAGQKQDARATGNEVHALGAKLGERFCDLRF